MVVPSPMHSLICTYMFAKHVRKAADKFKEFGTEFNPHEERVFANRFIITMRETLMYVKLPPIPQIFVELFLVYVVPVRPVDWFSQFQAEWQTGF